MRGYGVVSVSSLRVRIAARLRQSVPEDSKVRSAVGATWRGLRSIPVSYQATRTNLHRARPKSIGLDSYREWLAQHERAEARRHVDTGLRFAIAVVGKGRDERFRRTQRSIRSQGEAEVQVLPVGEGETVPLPGLVEGADIFLVVRAGTVFAADALDRIAGAFYTDPACVLVTFDSDVIDEQGRRGDPLFRPQWSPDTLLGHDYIGSAFAMRVGVAESRGPLTADPLALWRLKLAAGLDARQCAHIPRVLISEPGRPVAADPVRAAAMVEEALAARGERARVEVQQGRLRAMFLPEQWPAVSIVVPTRHSRTNMARLLDSLASTDYPSFDVQVMDNGEPSEENRQWYAQRDTPFPLRVEWWDEKPFNYSRVNNVGVSRTSGEVVVLLNDDTQVVDPAWLRELVGHALRPGVGTVGLQLRMADGRIQHGGVMVGPGGFADNLFAGLQPHSDTLIGSTDWYRDTLAVTGACVAVRRDVYEAVGGLDENFILCGSDVVLGLDQVIRGRRNLVLPFDTVRHFESLTRGSTVPEQDFHASYWRYYPWLRGGDPYVSGNVSRLSAVPRFANELDPTPVELALIALGRPIRSHAQSMSISEEAFGLLASASVRDADVAAVRSSHEANRGRLEVRTVNWFIPDIDMPFFGGLNTTFRLADKLRREHGVRNRFVVFGHPDELHVKTALDAAFPGLGREAEVYVYDGSDEQLALLPEADAAVATLWLTAQHVAKAPGARRRFYLMQDYEPAFYPASSMYAMAEESYRLGLYGICNTVSMHRIYSSYGGRSTYFVPAVDRGLFNPEGRREKADDEPVTIFAYARDHFRNCWELVYAALTEVKRRHGDGVRIIAAGARYLPEDSSLIDLGLLDYRQTPQIYRESDIGITMQISRHPSYLPLELMACGVPMVAPDSDWFGWLFESGRNSLLVRRSLGDLVDKIDRLVTDAQLRAQLQRGALETIDEAHSDWDRALEHVYDFMCDPENTV